MKRILLVIVSTFLAVVLILSGCTKTEYVTVTDTTTLPAVTTTETTTLTTSGESNYSAKVYQAIIAYVMRDLESKGLSDLVAGFVYGGDHMGLFFYGDTNEEIVEFVKASIDEIAPGFPLKITVGTIVTKIV